jgi:5'-deoxynucleotidase YfbR-like HD superfamily hydrolase/nucleoside phosphorylase
VTGAKYDFAVIVALNEEAEYFRGFVACGDPFQAAGFTAWPIVDVSWDAFGRGVLVMSGDMGFERARASTAAVVAELKPTLVANLGIAGRLADWVNIGDIVVPRVVLDFTVGGKIAGDPTRIAYRHRPEQKTVTSSLVGLAETHLQKDSKAIASINATLRKRFPNPALWPHGAVKLVVQPLASVPLVVANDEYRRSFAEHHRDVVAVEMESAGVMAALANTDVEFVSVRGISDGADFSKAELELNFEDENRRFALESACSALEAMLTLRVDQRQEQTPGAGIYPIDRHQILSRDQIEQIEHYEPLFSRLVHGPDREPVQNPISTISRLLRSDDYQEPIVLLGGQGAGKTTLMGLVQAETSRSLQGEGEVAGCLSISVRIGDLETWNNGVLDEGRTKNRVASACRRLGNIISAADGPVVVLVDGLNQTGSHRTPLIADLVKEAARHRGVRLLISAESEIDLRALYAFVTLNVQTDLRILPVEIDHGEAEGLVDDFARVKGIKDSTKILADMRKKDVRFVDLFILSLFFGPFRGFAYRDLRSLAQCYDLYCQGVLTEGSSPDSESPEQRLTSAAQVAYDLLISHNRKFADLNERNTAKLVSSHSSITSFLVARHIINVLRDARVVNGKSRVTSTQLGKQISFVFPADVNNFTKQIMMADRDVERDVIEVIKSKHRTMPTLGKSHFAYLTGRVRRDRAPEMLELLAKIDGEKNRGGTPFSLESRMLRRSVFISRSMLNDPNDAAIEYANILLTDLEESEFNRGFHLEYYGDAPFDPDGHMASRDNGVLPCNKTFAKLMERITAKPHDLPPLIELLTVLSLVQVRNLNATLRPRHRQAILDLLAGPQLRDQHLLPEKVRGYIDRIAEDLQIKDFRLSTVREEWSGLSKIERTGWLRRRRDAVGEHLAFWEGLRIESVAEHLVGVLALAEIFLTSRPVGEEIYDKRKVIEMILIHDLAESRLGDLLPKYTDPKQEEIALWQYGAFETYRGIGDLWRVPALLKEFNRGETVEAQIAKDLDGLQFILQARAYADGMSEDEKLGCEKASHSIRTATVRAIEKIVAGAIPQARFVTPIPLLD